MSREMRRSLAGQDNPIGEQMSAAGVRAWLTAIAASTDDAIRGKDPRGWPTPWNKGTEAMFGYALDDVIGRPITVIIPRECSEEENRILDRVSRGERRVRFETTRRRKDGRLVPGSLTIVPMRGASGSIVGVAKIARDLSATQQAEAHLRRREALLQSIPGTVPDALVVIDEQGVVQFLSASAEHLFGFRAAEVMGRNVSLLVPAPCREEHDSYLARYVAPSERRIIGIACCRRGRSEGIARSSGSGTGPPSVPSGHSRGEVPGTIQHTDQDGLCTRLLWRTRWPHGDRNQRRPCGMRDRSCQPRRLGR